MTKFVLITDAFEGNITFFFDSAGYLVEFQMNSWNIDQDQKAGMLKHLQYCLTDSQFIAWAQTRKYKVRRSKIDLSFNRFKIMYGIARDTFRAEPMWNKLKETERYYTLLNVKSYKAFCERNPNYIQMYPAAYLRNHRKDDWDKVPDWTGKAVVKG